MNGASARTSPMKRPIRIVSPPRLLEEPLDLVQPVLGDLQPLAVAQQPRAAEPAPERVGGHVAEHRAGPDDRDQHEQVDLPLAGDEAADQHRGLARRDQPDERAGLEEREHADEQVGPAARASSRRPRSASRCSAGRSTPVPTSTAPAVREHARAELDRGRACGGARTGSRRARRRSSSQPHFTPRAPPRRPRRRARRRSRRPPRRRRAPRSRSA